MKIKTLGSCLVILVILLSGCEKIFPPSPYHCESQPDKFKNISESNVSLIVLWALPSDNLIANKNKLIELIGTHTKQPFKLWLRDDSIESFTFSDKALEGKFDSAVISAVFSINETDPDSLIEMKSLISAFGVQTAIYAAQQSVPLAYERNWKSGEQTPALISMSFFQKPKGMEKKAFKEYWFCSHTPFAVDIHPLWHYERNAIEQALTENAPSYDGIVPLYVENDKDIAFSNFFSADGKNPFFNALRIQSDVNHFINLDLIETVPMREFVIDGKITTKENE